MWRAARAHWLETLGREPGAGLPPFLESRVSPTHVEPLISDVSGSAGFFSKVRDPQALTRLSYHHDGTWGHAGQLLALHLRVTLQILSPY